MISQDDLLRTHVDENNRLKDQIKGIFKEVFKIYAKC